LRCERGRYAACDSVYIEGPVDITSKPAYALRGMHLNGWAFRAPYSFRSWTEDDWR
jgi:hypothetical protein